MIRKGIKKGVQIKEMSNYYVDYDWTYYEGREYDNYSGNLQYTYNFTVFTKTAERFIPEYR